MSRLPCACGRFEALKYAKDCREDADGSHTVGACCGLPAGHWLLCTLGPPKPTPGVLDFVVVKP